MSKARSTRCSAGSASSPSIPGSRSARSARATATGCGSTRSRLPTKRSPGPWSSASASCSTRGAAATRSRSKSISNATDQQTTPEHTESTTMNLQVWQELVANHREMSELISAVTPEAAASDLDGMRPLLANQAMETLHGQLRQALARASAKLGNLLDGNDLKQILFILAIAVDEKVQRRLAPEEG